MKQLPIGESQRHAMASQNIGNALFLFLRRVLARSESNHLPTYRIALLYYPEKPFRTFNFTPWALLVTHQVLLRGTREHGAGEVLVLFSIIVLMDGYSLLTGPRDIFVRRFHHCECIFMQSHHHKLPSSSLASVFTNYVRLLRVKDSSSALWSPLVPRDRLSSHVGMGFSVNRKRVAAASALGIQDSRRWWMSAFKTLADGHSIFLPLGITNAQPRNKLAASSLDRILRVSKAWSEFVSTTTSMLYIANSALYERIEPGYDRDIILGEGEFRKPEWLGDAPRRGSISRLQGAGNSLSTQEKVTYILTSVYGSQI